MKNRNLSRSAAALASAFALTTGAWAQAANPPSPTAAAPAAEEESVVTLSPFEVSGEADTGYSAATTLAGNRLNTDLRDIGNAIQVVTSQFLKDTGAVNNETLLQYTTSTEVGSIMGNFAGTGDGSQLNETFNPQNANQNTRVRGLNNADNTRDYYLSNIPWDGYNIDRVDLNRGPNSILFGQGSPAGIINAGTKQAGFRNSGEVEFRVDNNESTRASVDINRELIDNELAVRVALLKDDTKYRQEPAFQDTERAYGALRYEPAFLKKGSARTIIKANYEKGHIDSNRPRALPPGDYITPWFLTGTVEGVYRKAGGVVPGTDPRYADDNFANVGDPRTYANLNKLSINPHLAQNDNFYRSNTPHGLTRPVINNGPFNGSHNPYFNPWIGNFGASIGGPMGIFGQENIGSTPTYLLQEIRETYGINTAGAIDGSIGFDFNRPIGIRPYSDYALQAGLEFGDFGVYKNNSLTDPSIFDFYRNLLDGPNKKEWQDFDVYNISLSQTFLNDKLGFDLSYNKEDYENGQLSLITDTRQAIYIDINKVYTDGTPRGTGPANPDNIPFDDATPNPNFGRPFINDNGQGGNNSFSSQREVKRATGFLRHDFAPEGQGSSPIGRFLGSHTLTALYSEDEQLTDARSWQRYAVLDPAYRAFLNSANKFNEGQTFVPSMVMYLGPSLANATSAAGANIPRATSVYTLTSGTMRAFDSHWANRPGVDPAAFWGNDAYPNTQTGQYNSTQSENPANYVGWTNMPVNITDSESAPGNRDLLTTSAQMQRKLTTSKAFVWQAELLDRSIIGTFGMRRDRAQGWSRSMNTDSQRNEDGVQQTRQYGHMNLTPDVYYLPTHGPGVSDLSETSKSWTAVVHFDRLPAIGDAFERLPVRVSAFYNHAKNFQPEALRVNIYGEQVPLPRGDTKDFGVMLSTKDNKYSLKINRYETEAKNASSSALQNAGFIGTSQAYGANWTNAYQYDFGTTGNQPNDQIITRQARNRPAGSPNPPGLEGYAPPATNAVFDPTDGRYNYNQAPGETLADAQAREAAVVAAWRSWQAKVDPRFYTAWGIDLNAPYSTTNPRGVTSSTPNGFVLTEDNTSEGYEIEFSAQPTRNWRFTLNAAKQKATRSNIGGAALADFVAGYQDALNNTPAGDLRIWWGGAGNETAALQWYNSVGSQLALRNLQNNTNVPELREWRVNAITNYDFTEGTLKGLNIGGGLRWQDEIVVGYPPVVNAGQLSFDLSQPYRGPAETDIDVWIGYGRRIWRDIDWRIQLNVRNLTTGDELIPITVQPDGSPAGYRIAPPRTFTLSNTFRF